ncbi:MULTISPECIES: DUF2515 family protein [unclassified Massilia]|uniref:DUF2515 family protein n=1 Tax=unclassified Massilia TaxID=2609279 RepID=UPI0017821D51|nr:MULTISPECIES: hypothetical protein [unclassified Massilia]MBD8532008.1 hypothetical protein [Massilia sp. CFBP 13647]MBD8675378.1 hypothetical protein [Massilia sp. CFBP 13721]
MMAKMEEKGVSIEVLGTCTTNTTEGSQHDAKVEYPHLWSYAQQAALIAVSDKNNQDGRYHLIQDPERRAKRIAGHYAYLYFESTKKSNGELQFYWPALAAFVVKDIVEAYRFTREDVLQREWKDLASVFRNSSMSDVGSVMMTDDSPYQHALRTYCALAKGNLWLFMDIYPWYSFFLEFGINKGGSLSRKRLEAGPPERNWETYQKASKSAIEELPFGPSWMSRLSERLRSDPVYKTARAYFDHPPSWSPQAGYGQYSVLEYQASAYCRTHVKEFDNGYRAPSSIYWAKFKQAFYIMEAERGELTRIANDAASIASLIKLRRFTVTPEVIKSYEHILTEYSERSKEKKAEHQRKELISIANQEQINVLQPLIYNDSLLKKTMDVNHRFSRLTNGWLSPNFKVVYSASPQNSDPELETVFDAPTSMKERLIGERQSLPDMNDRMEFVSKIAKQFNFLMSTRRSYMDGELSKILHWVSA